MESVNNSKPQFLNLLSKAMYDNIIILSLSLTMLMGVYQSVFIYYLESHFQVKSPANWYDFGLPFVVSKYWLLIPSIVIITLLFIRNNTIPNALIKKGAILLYAFVSLCVVYFVPQVISNFSYSIVFSVVFCLSLILVCLQVVSPSKRLLLLVIVMLYIGLGAFHAFAYPVYSTNSENGNKIELITPIDAPVKQIDAPAQ